MSTFYVISRLKDSVTVMVTDVRRFANFGELYKTAGSQNHMSVAPLKYKQVTIKGDTQNLVARIGYQGYYINTHINQAAWDIVKFQLKFFNMYHILNNTIGRSFNSYSEAEAFAKAWANDMAELPNYKIALGDKAADITDPTGKAMLMDDLEAENALIENTTKETQIAARKELESQHAEFSRKPRINLSGNVLDKIKNIKETKVEDKQEEISPFVHENQQEFALENQEIENISFESEQPVEDESVEEISEESQTEDVVTLPVEAVVEKSFNMHKSKKDKKKGKK